VRKALGCGASWAIVTSSLSARKRFPNAVGNFGVILVGENGCNLPDNLKDA